MSRLFAAQTCGGIYVSPDGTKALVLQASGRGIGPYILNLRSGKQTPVPVKGLNEAINPPDQPWSPDGKRLLLAQGNSNYSSDNDIIYDPRTHNWPTIANPKSADGSPVWAPDGNAVIYATVHDIRMVRLKGGSKTLVTLPRRWGIESLAVSGDGKWLSFLKDGVGPRLYVVRVDGSRLHAVSSPGASSGAWSPTGERLAFVSAKGLDVANLATGHTKVVAQPHNPAAEGFDEPPIWSPDGKSILYAHTDLGFGASMYEHAQLWAVGADGSDPHPISDAFTTATDVVLGSPTWVAAALTGRPVRRPPLVELGKPLLTTALPVVALGALGDSAAVATGFGSSPGMGVSSVPAPRGPIYRLGPKGQTSTLRPPGHCLTVSSIALAAGQFAYVCNNSQFEQGRYVFRLDGKVVARIMGGQGVGSFLGGPLSDGRAIAYSITTIPIPVAPKYHYVPGTTRIYVRHGSATRLVRTLSGWASLDAFDAGRIAVSAGIRQQAVNVYSPSGATRTLQLGNVYPSGFAFDGDQFLMLEQWKIIVIDLATGHKRVLRTALGTDRTQQVLVGTSGDLVAYVSDDTVHVMRISDGREVVLDTRSGTGPVHAQFVSTGLYYAYNEAYATKPGRVGFIGTAELERAISARGRQAR